MQPIGINQDMATHGLSPQPRSQPGSPASDGTARSYQDAVLSSRPPSPAPKHGGDSPMGESKVPEGIPFTATKPEVKFETPATPRQSTPIQAEHTMAPTAARHVAEAIEGNTAPRIKKKTQVSTWLEVRHMAERIEIADGIANRPDGRRNFKKQGRKQR
ncbi:hypothetical protein C0992_005802 [Termitomyces sp. T32_za158]|nr:hypothetical protein C0992_005802 [Termitomyces sp. T32_za158]